MAFPLARAARMASCALANARNRAAIVPGSSSSFGATSNSAPTDPGAEPTCCLSVTSFFAAHLNVSLLPECWSESVYYKYR
jgi:hypothetical protein